MTIERYLRLIAGTFILISLVLAHYHSDWWLVFTAFVGLNLLQSGLTNWCPMMSILGCAGVKSEAEACGVKDAGSKDSEGGES